VQYNCNSPTKTTNKNMQTLLNGQRRNRRENEKVSGI
jgi:hypothetical protein